MSERETTCKALAAMIKAGGDPTVDEMRFIAHVALELGLSEDENKGVESVLKNGAKFDDLLPGITQKDMQLFLFRQVSHITLIQNILATTGTIE